MTTGKVDLKMKNTLLAIALLVAAALPLAADPLTGTVSEWYGGAPGVSPKTRGLSGVVVVVGPDLDLYIGKGGADEVRGPITAKGGTNESGAYSLNVPAGKYTIIYWKEGYTPQVDTVVSPGSMNASIEPDKSMQGLHRQLNYR